ncbi:hypothetical protein OOU_Y34scaffold00068g3 [Pyricularia oryzae Y34]|uniref:Uncharacterized protein n=1 Tax=Pyricularia oryzae (strain Y34) TaxID=1143189 RepID=A0AA97P9U6_PYRO3|nr:hypothetical protein OOU_Y34scaffold00068g3 [Pyricularia oryzae Y34]
MCCLGRLGRVPLCRTRLGLAGNPDQQAWFICYLPAFERRVGINNSRPQGLSILRDKMEKRV